MSEDSVASQTDDDLRQQGFLLREGGRRVGSGRVTRSSDEFPKLEFAVREGYPGSRMTDHETTRPATE